MALVYATERDVEWEIDREGAGSEQRVGNSAECTAYYNK